MEVSMGKVAKFSADVISDQKRVARMELWLKARTLLRERDWCHNYKWKVLILAGGSPGGEIECIRELMPKAEIVAVDKDPLCVQAAAELGVTAICADLLEWRYIIGSSGYRSKKPNQSIAELGQLDAIHFDFCAGVNTETTEIVKMYTPLVRRGGAVMITFSYGRDVIEYYLAKARESREAAELQKLGIERVMSGRIAQILSGNLPSLVITYTGNKMPMCSVFWSYPYSSDAEDVEYVSLRDSDFEDYMLYFDHRRALDCTPERLESIRRSAAAKKAVATARNNRAVEAANGVQNQKVLF